MGIVIKAALIILGIHIYTRNLFSLARRQINPTFSVAWTMMGTVVLVLGIFLKLSEVEHYISWTVAFLLIVGAYVMIFAFYAISIQISRLMRQNYELSIHVSLLNEESRRLRDLKAGTGNEE